MKEIELAPIKESTEDYERLEAYIRELFRKEIYAPLMRELNVPATTLQNSVQDVVDVIRSGRITFYRGEFSGRFNASISRELKRIGAKWDRRQGTFKIPLSSLPPDFKIAISASEAKFVERVKKLDKKLQQILPEEIAAKFSAEKIFDTTLFKVDREFKQTVKGLAVASDLTESQRKKIAAEYTNNLRLYIKDWTEKEIVALRKKVQETAFTGLRRENLVKTIQTSYGVSLNKAKFLARQETSLLMTKFKESRYKDAGVNQYRWMTVVGSPAHPVRPMHKALAGKIFSWDDPPITDEKGNRNNPGQDYNCRCFAKPIVRFNESKER